MQANVATSVSRQNKAGAAARAWIAPVGLALLMLPAVVRADDAPAASLQARAQQIEAAESATGYGTVTTEHSYILPNGAPTADNQGRPYTEVSGISVQRWAGQGRASIGIGVGALGYRALGSQALADPSPALSVGVRYRMANEATLYAAASGTRRLGDADALYNTRVGLEFKGASTAKNLGLERGSIGMQLDSGYRISMRPRRGGVGVYLRGSF
jgi:hypothetical protein